MSMCTTVVHTTA